MTFIFNIILLIIFYIILILVFRIILETNYRIDCKKYLIKCVDLSLKQYYKTDKIYGDSYLEIFKDIENTIYEDLNKNKSHIHGKRLRRLIHNRLLESNVKEGLDIARGLRNLKK